MEIKLVAERKRAEVVSRFNEGLMKVVLDEFKTLSKAEQKRTLNGRPLTEFIFSDFQMTKNSIYVLYDRYKKRGYKNYPEGLSRDEFAILLKENNDSPDTLYINNKRFIKPISKYMDEFNTNNDDAHVKVVL